MRIFSIGTSVILFGLIGLTACKGSNNEVAKEIDEEVLDPNSSLNTVFDGKIFSIPSPIQTSMLIKELNLDFNSTLVNPTDNLIEYNTIYKQALNLGVFGTDLGYVSIYNKADQSIKYLAAIKKTTEKLGLNKAFDNNFIKRFESNLANQDSMMIIAADAFKQSDNFLKNTNRKAISILILAGGWIESMYIACELNQIKPSAEIVKRIGEQQLTLNTIIEALEEYNDQKINNELIRDMKDLQFYFEKVEFIYTYKPPTTDKKNCITTFNHEVEVKIDTDILNQITMKLRSIRKGITE
ncbi:MAG: hypothetical protein KJ941_10450 [Bacteroidetes bacterium]|nr:hypothetical protein [Bacteroidota bacterium]